MVQGKLRDLIWKKVILYHGYEPDSNEILYSVIDFFLSDRRQSMFTEINDWDTKLRPISRSYFNVGNKTNAFGFLLKKFE